MRTEVPRAPRYAVRLGLRYRQKPQMAWLDGQTQNISSSGVLFSADRTVPPDTPIEMNLVMPPQIVGAEAGHVVCFGRVVRIIEPHAPGGPAVAATIAGYHLVRSDQGDEAS